MKIDNKSVSIGDQVFDIYMGLGFIESFTQTGMLVRFEKQGSSEFLDGGYVGGQQRLGFKRKTFIEIPIKDVEIVTKVLGALGVTVKEGF